MKLISSDRIALIEDDRQYTYAQLDAHVTARAGELVETAQKPLVLLPFANDYASVVNYLAARRAGAATLLVSADQPEPLRRELCARYRPDVELSSTTPPVWNEVRRATPIHESVSVLLSSSGTTGSPKLVRLSAANLNSNATAIASYLGLTQDDRAITVLPLHYSYGLSVLNSHLAAGASVVISKQSVTSRHLWDAMRAHGVTNFAGVPYTFRALKKLRFEAMDLPLRFVTCAGGKLDDELQRYMLETSLKKRFDFYIMYGQTEATARIAYVPPQQLAKKLGAIGIPIPGGSLRIDAAGELIYSGENVMLGYAETEAELSLGDTQQGEINTGDLARMDDDGYFYVTGRLKRFLKVFGLRIGLDELEQGLRAELGREVVCTGKDEHLVVHVETPADVAAIRALIAQRYKLAHSVFEILQHEALPRLANGKADLRALE